MSHLPRSMPRPMKCCAKLYCRDCLVLQTRHYDKCPTCRKRISSFTDKLSNRRIKALKVSCDNEEKGCEWTGDLGSLEEHLAKKCNFYEVPCPNGCSASVFRQNLLKHLYLSCPLRKYKCQLCQQEGQYQTMTTTHLDECPKVIRFCPNPGCDVLKEASELPAHRDACPKQVVKCPYVRVGCKETMCRESVPSHRDQCMEKHLRLAVARVASLEDKVNIPPQTIHVERHNPSLRTKKFFSHPGGYELALHIYTNGNAYARGEYVSVHVHLNVGKYDNNLVWPFSAVVTVQLLNQVNDSHHCTKMFRFRAAARPSKDGIKAHSSKFRFIAHSKLEGDPSNNCQYLVNNRLYFRIKEVSLSSDNKPWLTPTD